MALFLVMFVRLDIFAFSNLKTARREDRGAELTLSVYCGITEKQDGKIEVNSAVGQGSTFIIELPLHSIKNEINRLSFEKSQISKKEQNKRSA